MELSPTARVILGMLSVGPKSGYDIKALTDKSTRFFWAASYGQIYPDLKRLADAGLIEGSEEPQGGRRRTVYRITAAGRDAFAKWLASDEMTHELRDEGLLKLFFAGSRSRKQIASVVRQKRDAHAAALAELRAIEPLASSAERFGPAEVLHYGLAYNEFAIAWCERTLEEIEKEN
jgi:PadR family transcriptional regulator, regulatory protein AphA